MAVYRPLHVRLAWPVPDAPDVQNVGVLIEIAPAKGEFLPEPSSAAFPGCVEKLIRVPTPLSIVAVHGQQRLGS
jgi:hypothetical protein